LFVKRDRFGDENQHIDVPYVRKRTRTCLLISIVMHVKNISVVNAAVNAMMSLNLRSVTM